MLHGILNVYKEKGYTSHDVVAILRRMTGEKKIGHTGTLDPDAEGVLPVCFGKATKVSDLLTNKRKAYQATLLLGVTTDTQDVTGKVVAQRETTHVNADRIREVIEKYMGEYEQVPPMYSALKVQGKKLYELAREGKEIERKSRKVHIYNLKILEINVPRVRFEVECSKGTYIRTLCQDIGEDLECGGTMEKLIRTQVGEFRSEESVTLKEVEDAIQRNEIAKMIWPIDRVFEEYPRIQITNEKIEELAYNGGRVGEKWIAQGENLEEGTRVRLYNKRDGFVGIYKKKAKEFELVKLFYTPSREEQRSAITIGKFDGLHLGHQMLVNEMVKRGKQENLRSVVCVMDFEPLWKEKDITPKLLMTKDERERRLKGKVDEVLNLPFDKEFRELTPEEFVREIIFKKLKAKYVVVGEDFHFGFQKAGNVEVLKSLENKYGYKTVVVVKKKYKNHIISSTYIKELITEGRVSTANKLLGYSYGFSGEVMRGNRIGRTLGFPTINVYPHKYKLLPPFGVYFNKVKLDGKWYPGIGNLGVKPTVMADSDVLIESFLFSYEGNAYGKQVEIELKKFQREEIKFESLEKMKERVDFDIREGKEYFTNR